MCKIMGMAGLEFGQEKNVWKFVTEMAKEMSKSNDDGLGYAAFSHEGNMWGERWLKNKEAFQRRNNLSVLEQTIMKEYKNILTKPKLYNKFGSIQDNSISSIILHTRLATSGKDFYNTHPFVRDNTALIHNGIIFNASELTMIQSSCDSETILNEYCDLGVKNDVNNIQLVADKLTGYYACAVLSTTEDDIPYMDIFKDYRAHLGACFIKELGVVVFATDISDVYKVCKKLKWPVSANFLYKENSLIRINAITGKVMNHAEFKPKSTLYYDTFKEVDRQIDWDHNINGTKTTGQIAASLNSTWKNKLGK